MELGTVVAVLLALGRPGALDEHGLEPGRAAAQAHGLGLAVGLQPTGLTRGALVLTRAKTGPGEEVSGSGNAAHLAADFGQDGSSRQGADVGDCAQQSDQSAKGGLTVGRLLVQLGNRGIDLAIDLRDRQVERVVLPEMELQQEAMMIGEPRPSQITVLSLMLAASSVFWMRCTCRSARGSAACACASASAALAGSPPAWGPRQTER
jgi:hypothetical protein